MSKSGNVSWLFAILRMTDSVNEEQRGCFIKI